MGGTEHFSPGNHGGSHSIRCVRGSKQGRWTGEQVQVESSGSGRRLCPDLRCRQQEAAVSSSKECG